MPTDKLTTLQCSRVTPDNERETAVFRIEPGGPFGFDYEPIVTARHFGYGDIFVLERIRSLSMLKVGDFVVQLSAVDEADPLRDIRFTINPGHEHLAFLYVGRFFGADLCGRKAVIIFSPGDEIRHSSSWPYKQLFRMSLFPAVREADHKSGAIEERRARACN